MARRLACQIVFVVSVVAVGTAAAQRPFINRNPSLNSSPAANQFMSQIQSQAIGPGLTGASQNALALSQGNNANVFQNLGRNPNEFLTARPTASSGSIFGNSRQTSQKPFTNASRGPTVSPWLGLDGNGVSSSDFSYNTFVRPMLQQQETNRNLQRQQQELGQRFQQLSGEPAFDPRGSQTQAPTGHTTVFQYFSHFYPSKGQRPARR
jgi:hypothetical protein